MDLLEIIILFIIGAFAVDGLSCYEEERKEKGLKNWPDPPDIPSGYLLPPYKR